MGGSKGVWTPRPPIQESALCGRPNEVHHADILTEVYAIALLGL